MTEKYGHIPDGFFLSEKEVKELRKSKKELTDYGKQRLKELMKNQEPYPVENHLTLKHEEMLELAERREKSNRVLQRYNNYYNMECASLPHGTPITPEHTQMITFQSMIDALRCEHLNQEYTHIAIGDIEDLIARLDEQATEYLERVRQSLGPKE